MIKQILKAFDWIDPALGQIDELFNDASPLMTNSHTFFFPAGDLGNHSIDSIRKLLADKGVKSYGEGYDTLTNRYMLSVSRAQAKFADYVLNQASIPKEERFTIPEERKPGFWGWLLGI